MLIFLLSLGGIPFVAGFWAKLYVFWAAIERGLYGLVFLGAVLTVVALYYYLLVARRMYIEAPRAPRAGADSRRCSASAIVVCVARRGRHGPLSRPVGGYGDARRVDVVLDST